MVCLFGFYFTYAGFLFVIMSLHKYYKTSETYFDEDTSYALIIFIIASAGFNLGKNLVVDFCTPYDTAFIFFSSVFAGAILLSISTHYFTTWDTYKHIDLEDIRKLFEMYIGSYSYLYYICLPENLLSHCHCHIIRNKVSNPSSTLHIPIYISRTTQCWILL